MSSLTLIPAGKNEKKIAMPLHPNYRQLSDLEIESLERQGNICTASGSWRNIFVTDKFDVHLIQKCEFSGFVIIGNLRPANLKYHDLELECGLYNSYIKDCVFGDDCAVRNVAYLENYRISDRVILFNIQEMSCTCHSKFGNGILKEGEPESNRVWIGVGNENDGRAVLPFESMIPADAYLWSHYRDDEKLLQRFVDLTEFGNTKKLDTFGIVENDAVIKNTTLIKDAKIGSFAYIKGAFKLKNMTVLSSESEPSQIGEGVEMVNGILGYASRVFYQAVAVRFIIGRNCQLKYGARVLNTVLGDNSTVSCCELLNNLIFPFHEQHHNSSFLIATTIMGQSNIAAGATVGSNHNSRSPDGEIYAERGFWPGLCSDFKHNCKFAAFTLVSKGSYQHELCISYPFSLVAVEAPDKPIHIIPAFWFLYNMFAIARNNSKFIKRDKRVVKVQHIETNPLAPDTMQEIVFALDRIIELSSVYLSSVHELPDDCLTSAEKLRQSAKDYLHHHPDSNFTLNDMSAQKKYGAIIYKPVKAYKEYRKVVKYFAANTLMDYCKFCNSEGLSEELIARIEKIPLFTEWMNVGGQIIPQRKLDELFAKIKGGSMNSWSDVHAFYDECDAEYCNYKTRYAFYLLEQLYSRPISEFTSEIFMDIINDVTVVSTGMYESSLSSRKKDYTDYFRRMVYRSQAEMTSVLGSAESNDFLKDLKKSTQDFNDRIKVIFSDLCK